MEKPKPDFLFECSWEVCNKVGGIYTVIISKADRMKEQYSNYFLVGPYFEGKAGEDFIEEKPPAELKKVFEELSKEGIECRFGTWQVKGEPKAVLIDSSGFAKEKDSIKKKLWDDFSIDSLNAGCDFEEPVVWAVAAGRLIEKFCRLDNKGNKKKVAAHFHEWMAGAGLLYLKRKGNSKVKAATVFTTHATVLGRTIAGSGGSLYEMIDSMEPAKEAYNYGVQAKHLTEKACAENCDIFTTVSEITSLEAEKILGRKPDVLLLNGLDMRKFPTFEECAIKHRKHREIIREFVAYHFFPHYRFDIEQTLLMFIVGRYEFKNKGIDIFIKSLAKLNEIMKKEGSRKTVVVFFWIPREVHGAKLELSLNKNNYYQIKEFVEGNLSDIQERIIDNIMECDVEILNDPKKFQQERLFEKDFVLEAKKIKLNFMKKGNPLIVTHNLPDEEHDAIMWNLNNSGLDNKEDDKVKVVFYPVYLTGVDGLIDLPYYDAITGCHLGLFPSYYEPWGYTPLESAALGVPSLTTDLGGFGRFLQSKKKTGSGVFVLKRHGSSEEETVEHFTKILHNFTLLDQNGRVKEKIMAKEISKLADWKELIKNYFNAHSKAVQKVWS